MLIWWLFRDHSFLTYCEDARGLPGRRLNRRAREAFRAERTATMATTELLFLPASEGRFNRVRGGDDA
jgi:hypothetical protein